MVLLSSEAGQHFAARMSDSGVARLTLLLDYFQPQEYGSWCGLAAAACAMNAFGGATTQAALFEEALIVTRSATRQLAAGLSLADLETLIGRALQQQQQQRGIGPATVRKASAADPALLTSSLDADLAEMPVAGTYSANYESSGNVSRSADAADAYSADPPPVLLVNVLRTVKQATTGHWMLVAGSVRVGEERWVLVLDPAAHKLGPHWLPELTLISCMATVNFRGEPRGYLAIESGMASRDAAAGHGLEGGRRAPPRTGPPAGRGQQEQQEDEEEFTLI